MKKFLFAIILAFPTLLFSQIFNPVEWEFSKEDLGGGEYELVFKASIEDGWYLYSQFVDQYFRPKQYLFLYRPYWLL